MKIIVTGKNISVNDKIQEAIDKKFEKLGKYFADDIKANIVIHPEKAKVKMEATIVAKGTIFRAEDVSQDIFDCIDIVADKLHSQMSKYKGKMLKRNKSNESVRFEMIPEFEDQHDEGKVLAQLDHLAQQSLVGTAGADGKEHALTLADDSLSHQFVQSFHHLAVCAALAAELLLQLFDGAGLVLDGMFDFIAH